MQTKMATISLIIILSSEMETMTKTTKTMSSNLVNSSNKVVLTTKVLTKVKILMTMTGMIEMRTMKMVMLIDRVMKRWKREVSHQMMPRKGTGERKLMAHKSSSL